MFLFFPLEAKTPIRTEYGVITKVTDGAWIEGVTDNGTGPKIRPYRNDAPETAKGSNGIIRKKG